MKVAFLAESDADEFALQSLVDGLLGEKTERSESLNLQSRGWQSVLAVVQAVVQAVHFAQDADAFAVIIDSNGTPPHRATHLEQQDDECRLCILRQRITEKLRQL